MIKLTVNGRAHAVDAEPDTPLLYVLRNELGLNGAKFGCGLGQCGACTVIVDGAAVLPGRQVMTIEGLGTEAAPGPVQRAFIAEQAAQCGYCIAGMVMRTQALLARTPDPSAQQIRDGLNPNLCRCGTHMRIIAAVRRAAVSLRAGAPAKAATQ
jgi:nicotinate dehydrogenase subunit A